MTDTDGALDLVLNLGGWSRRMALAAAVTIGRSPDCEIQVPDGRLSRSHLRLFPDGAGRWRIEDLGSSSGTSLNGEPLLAARLVQAGDRFEAGPLRGELATARREVTVLTGDVNRDTRVVARLLRAVDALHGASDLPQVLATIVDEALALSGCERGAALLVGAKGELEASVARDRAGDELPAEDVLTRTLPRRALQTGRPVVATNEAELLGADGRSAHALQLRSVVCVPCLGRAGPVAVLYLDSQREVGLGPAEIGVLEALASHGALAIERAELRAREAQAERRRNHELERENARLKARVDAEEPLGQSPAFLEVLQTVRQLAASDITVCLTGETGTGKEVVARYAHALSPRGSRPFVAVDCGAIPEGLIESELFGHERGAFTGAAAARPGRFREADGGTVFLDEIAELPLDLQTRLLRVLQERTVQPVGATGRLPVDVRVICATHRDLEQEVEAGRFRRDLYYRVAVVGARLPSLRERGDDVALLAHAFLRKLTAEGGRRFEGFSREALQALATHPWEGNVRELRHRVQRATVLGAGPWVTRADLGLGSDLSAPETPAADRPVVPLQEARARASERFEREYLAALLTLTHGNVSQAAEVAGVSRQAIQRLMKLHDVDSSRFRPRRAGG